MRIFVQYSVSGFKIFDTSRFAHPSNGGRYCTMKEISDTNKGDKAGTHIINIDLHGLSRSVVDLFSSPLVEMLLQETLFEEREQTMLYVNNVGTSVNQNRDCNIVVLLVSEQESDKNLLSEMTLALLSDKRNTVLPILGDLLDKRIIGDELVLFYNEEKWQSIVNLLNQEGDLQCDCLGQVLLPTQGIEPYRLFQGLPNTFNHVPYRIIHRIENPLRVQPVRISSASANATKRCLGDSLIKIIKTLKNEINYHSND